MSDGANGGMGATGLLSFISGVIMIIVYCKAGDETNGNSLTLYNSFRAAIFMNVTLFAIVNTEINCHILTYIY